MENDNINDADIGEQYRKHPLDKVDNITRQKDRIGFLVTQLTVGKRETPMKNMDLANRLMLSVSYLEGLFRSTIDNEYATEKTQLVKAYQSKDNTFNENIPKKYQDVLITWSGDPQTVKQERKALMYALVQLSMLSNLEVRVKAKSRTITEVRPQTTDNYILNNVKERLWKFNQNWLSAFLGGTGTGKSWSALAIADYVDSNFTIDNVFFDIKELIKAIAEKRIVKGSCAILDEAGISFGSRDFMTRKNKQLSYLFQSMRYMNFGLIMTVPNLQLIDKHGRDLLHMTFRTLSINRQEGYVHSKLQVLDFDPLKAEAYPKKPRIWEDGMQKIAEDMHIYKPRQSLIDVYEVRKREFGDNISKKALKDDKPKKPEKKPNAKCEKCDYEWFTKSQGKYPKCTMCGGRGRRIQ